MTPERWGQLKAVFEMAVQCPMAEREAALSRVCAGDAVLRAEVERMLASDAQAERAGFLEIACIDEAGGMAHTNGGPASIPAPPGYAILEELGRGGMGVVYKARQAPINRLVALKMMLTGAHAGPHELNRFRKEAEAVARLEHPHIVRLYDYGDLNGLPYFSMELVEGGNLAQKLAGTPQPPKAAAELVETLARAMHYAHERGIVHRDLKPANILLSVPSPESQVPGRFGTRDTGPETPKIADFGLAKRLDASSAGSRSGAIMGTTSYMAPEQARGESKIIGPATDVYALGAMLYEMLTGRPPFRADSPLETLRQVAVEVPISVSRLQSNVPRDLATICQKCLHKEPGQRYPSANALGDDLRRFLDGQPVLARRAGTVERLWRWSRRNPGIAGLTTAVLLLFLAGFVGTAWQWRRAEAKSRISERNFDEARRAIERLALVAAADLRPKAGTALVRRTLLTELLRYYRDLLAQQPGDPLIEQDLGYAYQLVGACDSELGTAADARDAYRQSVALLEPVCRTHPDGNNRHWLGASFFYMGLTARAVGQAEQACDLYERAIGIQNKLLKEAPRYDRYRRNLALYCWAKGDAELDLGHLDRAQACYEKAQTLQEALVRQDPNDACRSHLGYTYNSIGSLLQIKGRHTQALAKLRQAATLRKQVLANDRKDVDSMYNLARTRLSMALSQQALDQWENAADALKLASQALETLVQGDPERVDFRRTLAECYLRLGTRDRVDGRFAEALRRLDKVREMCRRLLEHDPAILQSHVIEAEALQEIGLIQQAMRQPLKSRESFRQSVAAWQELVQTHPTLPHLRRGLKQASQQLEEREAVRPRR